FQVFDGLQAVTAGALRGLRDTQVPMVFALLGYWVPGLGTAVFLGFFTPLQGVGVWLGLAVGLIVVALLMIQRWARRVRLGLLPVRERFSPERELTTSSQRTICGPLALSSGECQSSSPTLWKRSYIWHSVRCTTAYWSAASKPKKKRPGALSFLTAPRKSR